MKDNLIRNKTYEFALKIVKNFQNIKIKDRDFILVKQLIRSATSIGANLEEGISGVSKKEFISRLTISFKEANETRYWLRLLKDSGNLSSTDANDLIEDITEIIKILSKIISSSKKNV